jgi:hypothetical protein
VNQEPVRPPSSAKSWPRSSSLLLRLRLSLPAFALRALLVLAVLLLLLSRLLCPLPLCDATFLCPFAA